MYRSALAAAVVAVLACGCSGTTSPQVQVPAEKSVPVAAKPTNPAATPGPAVAACSDCWPMFMHDAHRTGLQTTQTGINSSTAAQLNIRWAYLIGEETSASPVVADGYVFISTGAGSVIAFDERTGTPVWRRQLGGPITMTPTVDSGVLFVATHVPPAQFFALDDQTGATRWQTSFPGAMRGSPLAIGGIVYVPESGGDPPMCAQGGIHAYEEMTGTPVWTWVVDPKPNDGGSVWSSISYDGTYLVFGTGNTCSPGVANANSVVQLTLGGQQNWLMPQQVNSYVDDDFGGGQLIVGNRVFTADKNGKYYALDEQTGSIVWSVTQSPIDGDGSIGSSATNGSVIVAPSGFLTDPATDPSAFIGGYDFNGNLLWQVPTGDVFPGGAALTNDVAIVSIDNSIVALDINTGAPLWSYPSPSNEYFYASPAVVSSGIYAVDVFGGVYALSLGTTASTSARHRLLVEARNAPRVRTPFGSIFRKTPGGAVLARY
jgi:outer membrane protein assembly factor BamB